MMVRSLVKSVFLGPVSDVNDNSIPGIFLFHAVEGLIEVFEGVVLV